MLHTHDVLRTNFYKRIGLMSNGDSYINPINKKINLKELKDSEWCPEFETLMRNRLLIGSMRYGLIGSPGKPKYDRPNCMINRLNLYKETGNLEHLVDIANLALLEYVEGDHPDKHWNVVDDHDYHTKIIP